jgi:hypothetical protein
VDWWSIQTALEQDLFDMGGGHLPPYLGSGLVINLACKACSIWVVDMDIYHHINGLQGLFDWVVDIYHHICAVDWCSAHRIRARSVRYGWWTSTTWWTGDQFGLQGLFDMGGGHLPPYLCSGLVLNLTCKTCSMSVVDIYHHICEVDWWSICLVQSTALEQDLFDMGGGHLPPYLGSGLVINLACKACSIWVVDIYHHIWAVDW